MRLLTFLSLFLIMAVSCQNTGNKEKSTSDTAALTAVSYEIIIEGMTCTGCEETVKAGINKLDGIKSVEAHFTNGNALVEYYEVKTDTTAIKEAITGSGYLVKGFKPISE